MFKMVGVETPLKSIKGDKKNLQSLVLNKIHKCSSYLQSMAVFYLYLHFISNSCYLQNMTCVKLHRRWPYTALFGTIYIHDAACKIINSSHIYECF